MDIISEKKKSQNLGLPKINWFNAEEIEIKPSKDIDRTHPDGLSEVNFIHPRQEERHSIIEFPVGDDKNLLIRCLFRIRRNSVADFMVQVEVKGIVEGKESWQPVVRYDCAHNFIHRDLIDINGNKTKKELPTQMPKRAVEIAIHCFCQSKMRPVARENRAHLGVKRMISRVETAPT